MKKFSSSWKSSKKPRKQRKYKAKAPLHTKHRLLSASLSKNLRNSSRSMAIRVGDKVKVTRGDLSGKEGKVERVNVKQQRIYITGLDRKKRDGSTSLKPFHPSNLLILELHLDDKKRKAKHSKKSTKQPKQEVTP